MKSRENTKERKEGLLCHCVKEMPSNASEIQKQVGEGALEIQQNRD